MIDPFPIAPPSWLVSASKPLADKLNLHSLPLHVHEVLFAAAFYTFTQRIISPLLSRYFFPNTYPRLSRRTQINWDVHVVSFVQACIINGLSLWVIWCDEERKVWRDNAYWKNRIWSYQGSGGLCQSFALGYFVWDLVMCSVYPDIFGVGMFAHALSAVAVFGLGYRPFIYFSAPIFLLYELSSPFLNIHWFCDKLDLTGSIYQAINGAFLVATFFGCRLVWGIYSSIWVFRDMYWVYRDGHTNYSARVPSGKLHTLSTQELLAIRNDPIAQTEAFNREEYLPLWIPIVYLLSNVVLNTLNVFWFGKMIETIRQRFDPPLGTKGTEPEKVDDKSEDDSIDSDLGIGEPGKLKVQAGNVVSPLKPKDASPLKPKEASPLKAKGSVKAARQKAEEAMDGGIAPIDGDVRVDQRVLLDGGQDVEVSGSQRRSARSRRKA